MSQLENSSNSPLLTCWGIILMAVICNNASGKNPQRFLTSLKGNVTFLLCDKEQSDRLRQVCPGHLGMILMNYLECRVLRNAITIN